MYEIKTEDVYEDFSRAKEMFDFNNYSAKPKYYDDSKKLVVGKMEDEKAGVAIEEFVGLKPKMYLFLVDDCKEHKKAKAVNKNVVAIISQNKYKDFLLNNKCLRLSMNRTQSKTYETKKIYLSCFDDKINILNNRYDRLALGYQSYKTSKLS